MQKVLSSLMNLQPIIANGLLDKRQLAFINPHLDMACEALIAELAKPEQEPVGEVLDERGKVDWISFVPPTGTLLYTVPPQRQPLTVDQVWQNDQLMSLNADLGCSMDLLMEVVRVIEAKHGIKEQP